MTSLAAELSVNRMRSAVAPDVGDVTGITKLSSPLAIVLLACARPLTQKQLSANAAIDTYVIYCEWRLHKPKINLLEMSIAVYAECRVHVCLIRKCTPVYTCERLGETTEGRMGPLSQKFAGIRPSTLLFCSCAVHERIRCQCDSVRACV